MTVSERPLNPTVVVEVSGLDRPWRELNCQLTGAGITRGADSSGATDTLKVGTASMTLYGPIDLGVDEDMKPNGDIRIRHRVTGETLYTGSILDVTQTFEWSKDRKTKHTYTNVATVDAVQSLANTTRYGVVAPGGRETWAERIIRLNASAGDVAVSTPANNNHVIYKFPQTASTADGWTAQAAGAAYFFPQSKSLSFQISNPSTNPWDGTQLAIPQAAIGVQRTFTGLTVGKTYEMTFELAYSLMPGSGEPNDARYWRVQIDNKAWSAETELVNNGGGLGPKPDGGQYNAGSQRPIAPLQFVATATSHVIRLANARSFSLLPGTFSAIYYTVVPGTLSEVAIPDDYQLQDVVYESSLLNHYQLACDSVGARFWVDASNVVQFRRQAEELDPTVTFIDTNAASIAGRAEESYTAIDVAFDTRSIVNSINIAQHGRQINTSGEPVADDYSLTVRDDDSVVAWGLREGQIDTCIWVGFEHELDLEQRARDIFEERAVPAYTVTHVRWNAQSNLALAFQLDIYDRVRIIFEGFEQTSRIAKIKHDISPTRWIVDLWFTDSQFGPTFDEYSDYYNNLTFDQLSDLYEPDSFDAVSKRPLREH